VRASSQYTDSSLQNALTAGLRSLATTAATSVTGFLFLFHGFLPSHGVGIASLIVLAVAILARYRFGLAGGWRRTYAITAVLALI
jgi:hypothetical protein